MSKYRGATPTEDAAYNRGWTDGYGAGQRAEPGTWQGYVDRANARSRSAAGPAELRAPVIDAIIATIRRDDLCEDTDGKHHTDEYITAFLLSLDTELRARAAIRENAAARWSRR